MSGHASATPPIDAEPSNARRPRRLHLYSTPESVEAGCVTVLALVETIGAVVAYGWTAVRYGTLHLTIACIVAPLVLLRTNESVARGLRWWHAVWTAYAEGKRVTFGVLAYSGVSLVLGLWFLPKSLDILGLLIAIVLATCAPALTVAVCVRVGATVAALRSAPFETVGAIPHNWFRVVATVDSAFQAELVPGAVATRAARVGPGEVDWDILLPGYTASQMFRSLFKKESRDELSWWKYALALCLLLPMICATWLVGFVILMLPAWLYRWSIKGTSLLLFPLAVLVREAPRTQPKHIKESLAAKGMAAASGSVLLVALKGLLGLELPDTEWYSKLAASARANRTLAAFFPAHQTPLWQVLIVVGAAIVFAGYFLADRRANKGFTRTQKLVLDCGYFALGGVAVATIFSLIYTAASAALVAHID